jgi:hypothetical protein
MSKHFAGRVDLWSQVLSLRRSGHLLQDMVTGKLIRFAWLGHTVVAARRLARRPSLIP